MSKTVLLLDDDQRFRSLFVLAAGRFGLNILQCNSIYEADNVLALAGNIDLLVIDRQLPDGDGIEWLRSLRRGGLGTPSLIISANLHDSASFHEINKNAGRSWLLQKPISIDALCQVLHSLLANTGNSIECVNPFQTESLDLSQEFATLRSEFLADLIDRLGKLEKLISDCAFLNDRGASIEETLRELHMLRGSCGAYGFAEIGRDMGLIEDLLRSALNNDGSHWRASLEIALRKLRKSIALLESLAGQTNVRLTEQVVENKILPRLIGESRTKVILVSDDSGLTQRLKALFSSEGMLVYTFQNTGCLMSIIEELEPSVILIDCASCQVSSPELCRFLAKEQARLNLSVLALADSLDSELARNLRDAGICKVMTRAAGNIEFLNALKQLCAK